MSGMTKEPFDVRIITCERCVEMTKDLPKEDYEEPRCLLNMHPEITPIPVGRVIEKLDACLNRNDYEAAERLLNYWLNEAEACNDARGKLTVLNEQIGLYRKTGREAECFHAVSEALSLADAMDISRSVTYGTTLVNAATACKAFGREKDALPLYRRAQKNYETSLDPEDERLGGLYNNMALALAGLQDFREAEMYYNKAIRVMEKQQNGAPDVAITCLNLADLVAAESGLEAGAAEIDGYLQRAERLLNTEGLPREGYYAYVCEKCAPVFGYYGYFMTEQELNRRAKEIRERY